MKIIIYFYFICLSIIKELYLESQKPQTNEIFQIYSWGYDESFDMINSLLSPLDDKSDKEIILVLKRFNF